MVLPLKANHSRLTQPACRHPHNLRLEELARRWGNIYMFNPVSFINLYRQLFETVPPPRFLVKQVQPCQIMAGVPESQSFQDQTQVQKVNSDISLQGFQQQLQVVATDVQFLRDAFRELPREIVGALGRGEALRVPVSASIQTPVLH